jgi:flagellar biosynthesis protein FliQ
MTPDQATDILRTTLILVLLVAGPVMIVGLLVGLVISIIQAVTQIQEQTLTFIPKIAAMLIAVIILLPWIGVRLIEYTQQMLRSISIM